MPAATKCFFNGDFISVSRALALKARASIDQQPEFQCIECKDPVRPHRAGGKGEAHFAHLGRNALCSLSHRRRSRVNQLPILTLSPEDEKAIEGYRTDRLVTTVVRNQGIVRACKKRDNNTCQACGFHLKVGISYVIDCHHKTMVSNFGAREITLNDLVVSQVELAGKKSMDFFGWQGVRTPHGEPCKDEQRSQAGKDTIYSRRFSLTDYERPPI